MNKRYILKLYSRESLKTMSKNKKKLYKLLLTALSANLLSGNILNADSEEIVGELNELLEQTYSTDTYNEKYESYKEYLLYQFSNGLEIFNVSNEKACYELVKFCKIILQELVEKSVSIHTKKELDKYMNIDKYLKDSIHATNWIGINFETGVYFCVPEKLVWCDFKIMWNLFAQWKRKSLEDWKKHVDNNTQEQRNSNKESKLIDYNAGAMERSVLVNCIIFIESFLYGIRMSINEGNLFKNNPSLIKLKSVLKKDKINDTEIVEKILFNIYPTLKENIKEEYMIYKDLLKLRDRYIHISVRRDNDGIPEVGALLSSNGLNIEFKISYALKMVEKINNIIFESENIDILWWMKKEKCDFESLELFKIV